MAKILEAIGAKRVYPEGVTDPQFQDIPAQPAPSKERKTMPDLVPPPPQNSSLLIPSHPLIGREENMKLLFDNTLALTQQALIDNQRDARRRASNDSAFDHMISMAVAAALSAEIQTGETEDQQTVSPVRTAVGDAIVGSEGISADAAATANAAIAASLGQLATALVPIITAAGGVVSAQTLAAMLPVVIAAAGQAGGTASPKAS